MSNGIKWTLAADGSQAEKALNSIERHVDGVKDSIKGLVVTAFGLYGIEEIISKTVETASELVNASKGLNIPIERLQVLKQAAKNAGVEFDKLKSIFDKINIARDKALGGGAGSLEALRNFQKLGVSKQDLLSKTAEQLFTGNIAGAVKSNRGDEISSQLKAVVGKSFSEIIPLLKTDFDSLGNKMKNFGMIMDTETAVKLHHLGDEFGLLGNIITTLVGPALIKLVDWFLGAITDANTVIGKFVEWTAYFINSDKNKQPDFKSENGSTFTAQQRHDSAQTLRDFLNDQINVTKKIIPNAGQENINSTAYDYVIQKIQRAYPEQLANPAEGSKGETYGFDPQVFSDYKGENINDLLKYLNGVTQPVDDADIKTFKDTDNTTAGIKDSIDAFQKQMKQEADDLKNPKAPDFSKKVAANFVGKKGELGNMVSNDMLKIGGLAGIDTQYRLQRLAEESNKFLRQIAQNTTPAQTNTVVEDEFPD